MAKITGEWLRRVLYQFVYSDILAPFECLGEFPLSCVYIEVPGSCVATDEGLVKWPF